MYDIEEIKIRLPYYIFLAIVTVSLTAWLYKRLPSAPPPIRVPTICIPSAPAVPVNRPLYSPASGKAVGDRGFALLYKDGIAVWKRFS